MWNKYSSSTEDEYLTSDYEQMDLEESNEYWREHGHVSKNWDQKARLQGFEKELDRIEK